MKERDNFTLKSTPKDENGTMMGRRSFMLDKMHKIMRRTKSIKCKVNFHKCGMHQQTMAWVLSQNIKAIETTLNEMNAKHNILHE
jgi:hypothetical protein